MATSEKKTSKSSKKAIKSRPALSPEARENQLISLSVDLAEQQLRDGTASSQVITHFLKLGSTKHKEEMEKLKNENALLKAKTQAVKSAEDTKKTFEDAIKAFSKYSGNKIDEIPDGVNYYE